LIQNNEFVRFVWAIYRIYHAGVRFTRPLLRFHHALVRYPFSLRAEMSENKKKSIDGESIGRIVSTDTSLLSIQ
jgi:hypothetical protein